MDTIESELRAMLSDTFNRSKLLVMLKDMQTETEKREARKAARTPKEAIPPVTRYTAIKRNYTCHHCGAKFSSVVQLSASESVPSLNEQGRAIIITSNSPAEVECSVYYCKHCESFISSLSREAREARYLKLLSQCPLHFHASYVRNLNIEEHVNQEIRL